MKQAMLVALLLGVAAGAAAQGFTFVQMCDPHYDEKPEFQVRYKQAIAQINELKPDFVIICGDMTKPQQGDYVRVTGVSSCEKPEGTGVSIPVIRVRRQSDILGLD